MFPVVPDERITLEEFERLPKWLGWKYELVDGRVYLEPRHLSVCVTMPVAARQARLVLPLRPPAAADADALTDCFFEAFVRTSEYYGWREEMVRKEAAQSISSHFAGKRGCPHPCTRIAMRPDGEGPEAAAAALFVHAPEAARLDLLFIHPVWQRRGLATSLLHEALQCLTEMGVTTLESEYHVANEPSAAWHARMGFVEEPDLSVARARRYWHRNEAWRLAELGLGEREALLYHERERDRWAEVAERLERISVESDFESVTPSLRRRLELPRGQDSVQGEAKC